MDVGERERVFDEWIVGHKGLLFKVVRAFAATPQDQDDLFQQITLQLWESIPTDNGHVAATTWIYRVAFYAANG